MGASLPFCAHIGAMHALFHSDKEFQRCAQVGTMLAIFHSVCVCEREREIERGGGEWGERLNLLLDRRERI